LQSEHQRHEADSDNRQGKGDAKIEIHLMLPSPH
jgi:hypothetical protein